MVQQSKKHVTKRASPAAQSKAGQKGDTMLNTRIENIIFKTTALNEELKEMQKSVKRAETYLQRHKDMPIKLVVYEKGFYEREVADGEVITAILKAYATAARKRIDELEDEIEDEFKKYKNRKAKK